MEAVSVGGFSLIAKCRHLCLTFFLSNFSIQPDRKLPKEYIADEWDKFIGKQAVVGFFLVVLPMVSYFGFGETYFQLAPTYSTTPSVLCLLESPHLA